MRPRCSLAIVALALCGIIPRALLRADQPRNAAPVYRAVATLPGFVNGQRLRDFAFDAAPSRLFSASDLGLYWSELNDPTPSVKGPLFTKSIVRIEIAPDVGRVFYLTEDEIGYADVRDAPTQPVTLAEGRFWQTEIVYEPETRQVYVATRTPKILVFEAATGRRAPDVEVPGWYAFGLEVVPGRVFMNLANRAGLYQLDAASAAVTSWPIQGRVVTPARLEADPSGRMLFAAYDRFIVAVDLKTAREVGRITATRDVVMAFDPGTGVLLASWVEWQRARVRLRAYRADASGFTPAGAMEDRVQGGAVDPTTAWRGISDLAANARASLGGLEPTRHGFIQRGYDSILVWKASGDTR